MLQKVCFFFWIWFGQWIDQLVALQWIHGAGWVHRDLSVGNLYLYKGRGLIGDFEYAKRKNADVNDEALAVSSLCPSRATIF